MKAVLYTVNSNVTVPVDGIVPLGSIDRRYGCAINLNGNGIIIGESGYYDVAVSVTAEPTAAGIVTVTLLKDGVAVPGAVASGIAAAATNPVSLAFNAMVRQFGECSGSTLTLQLTGTASVLANVAVKVMRA